MAIKGTLFLKSLFLYCSNIYTEIREYKVRTCPEILVEYSFIIVFFFLCLAKLSLVIFQEGLASGSPKTINIALWGGLRPVPCLVTIKWQPKWQHHYADVGVDSFESVP